MTAASTAGPQPGGAAEQVPSAARGVPLDRAKLLAARFRAAGERPYLATALYSLTVVPSERVPTMGVDRHWRCYVSPAFVAETPVEELAGVWIHEVAHLLRDHHGRADRLTADERADHHRVNLAQDCEINDDLVADGLPLPEGRIHPALYDLPTGRLFEQYLPSLPATPRCRGRCAGSAASGDANGVAACDCPSVECGSGAHGHQSPWELAEGAAPIVRGVEADAIRRQTAQAVRAHARGRGTVPAGWQRWAEQILEPTIDWRQALAGAVREAAAWAGGAVDYTYRRPSRRGAALPGVVLPSLRRPLPRVAIVIDTSGSMSDDDLAAVLAEVGGVLRAVGVRGNRVAVLACDADVHAARRVSTVGEVVLAGGGGTDMRVGITAALAVPEPPHFVIVLTDGYTPWPDAALSRTRIIAGLVGADAPKPPSWIEAIPITMTSGKT
ncbi:vWA domain-containing protein [Catellatospora sichuanensis]|uniref:vWA domain-containing protein n=1 Tax=Catellatospora sichuanensis TaxID=1969805 RepID=UPI00118393DB|nr:VWA-like domain-containing protein [Catellatospora sichuanensis]